jgi:hypothetical protein
MYSFAPSLRVLNGELQTLIGLRDVARITGSGRARRLFTRAEPAARRAVRGFDTGAWSLYSAGGKESTLSYHRLVAGFLGGLCRRTGAPTYCAAGRRFERYVREPPRVHVRALRKVRVRRRATIRFTLSKVSDVMLQVRDRRGRVELSRGLRGLPHGRHAIVWVPARAGRHRLQIVAVGPAATRAVLRRTLTVHTVRSAKQRRTRRPGGRQRSGAPARARAGAGAPEVASAAATAARSSSSRTRGVPHAQACTYTPQAHSSNSVAAIAASTSGPNVTAPCPPISAAVRPCRASTTESASSVVPKVA